VLFVAPLLGGCVLAEQEEDDVEIDEATSAEVERAEVIGEAFCRWYYDCGCEPEPESHESLQECRLHVAAELTRRVEQGRDAALTYDGQCLTDVAAYFESAECSSADDLAFDAELRGALDVLLTCKPWHGGATEGDACVRLPTAKGDDCQPGLSCDVDFDVCVPTALVGEGAPCGGLSPECQAGLTCVADGDADRCVRLAAPGEACVADRCAAGSWCSAESGTCIALPVDGEACVDGGNPFEFGCARGHSCTDGHCVVSPGEGQACDEGSCAPGLSCDQGRCMEAAPLVCSLEGALP